MAVRKIKYNDRSVTGSFFSTKMNSNIEFESSLERDFFTWCEFNNRVDEYLHQPLSIEYKCKNGVNRIYTPDVLVIFSDSRDPHLIELKYKKDIKDQFPENKEKYRAAVKYCVPKNWKFLFVNEDIRTDYLQNAKFLLSFDINELNEFEEDKMIVFLRKMKDFTPKSFIESFAKTDYVRGVYLRFFWILVLKRIVICDLNRPLNMNTKCFLKDEYEFYY